MKILRWTYVIFLVLVGLVGLLMSACGGFVSIKSLFGAFQDLIHGSSGAWAGSLVMLFISVPFILVGIGVVGMMWRLVKNTMTRRE